MKNILGQRRSEGHYGHAAPLSLPLCLSDRKDSNCELLMIDPPYFAYFPVRQILQVAESTLILLDWDTSWNLTFHMNLLPWRHLEYNFVRLKKPEITPAMIIKDNTSTATPPGLLVQICKNVCYNFWVVLFLFLSIKGTSGLVPNIISEEKIV